MAKPFRFFCAFALAGLTVSPSAVAEEPVPPVRPLSAPEQRSFLEGVDVPPLKPSRPVTETYPSEAANGSSFECIIPNGMFDSFPAFNGEKDGDPACGVAEPVKLTGVHGENGELKFSEPAVLTCEFAKVLVAWLHDDVLTAAKDQLSGPVLAIRNGPGYQCRRRNNLPDGKLSEHALGKALDLSGFTLADGSVVSVEADWGAAEEQGLFLKSIHASACKRFTTVLGPDADASHKSHMHLDIGCHGKTCTYLICQ